MPGAAEGNADAMYKVFKAQLYWSMIGQALVIKQNIELTRSINRFGVLVWQLNEIWPTVGWGSLEYGPAPGEGSSPGQLQGGRWKPLHYFYKQSLMTDVMATCGAAGACSLSATRFVRCEECEGC